MEKNNQKFTEKDLLYISDMFNWNMETLKLVDHFIDEVNNEDIKELLEEIIQMHYDNLCKCISILKGEHCECECEECECCTEDEEEYEIDEEEEYEEDSEEEDESEEDESEEDESEEEEDEEDE